MPKLSDFLLRPARQLYRWVFPQLIERDEKTEMVLHRIYPTIDWQHVRFYHGLPWFIRGGFVKAIVLPATWGRRGVHVYFRNYRPDSFYNLMTVVHEGFHVLQYHDLGTGIGFFRRFMIYYLSEYLQLFFKNIRIKRKDRSRPVSAIAYEKHPMEIPAYAYEAAFRQHAMTQKGVIYTDAIPAELMCQTCGYQPQVNLLFLLMGGFITFVFTLIKPLIELCFLIIATPIWLMGKALNLVGL